MDKGRQVIVDTTTADDAGKSEVDVEEVPIPQAKKSKTVKNIKSIKNAIFHFFVSVAGSYVGPGPAI
jgi:hypothetical protein